MTFAYAITQIGVTSPDVYAEYIRLGLPTIQQYGERTRYRGLAASLTENAGGILHHVAAGLSSCR